MSDAHATPKTLVVRGVGALAADTVAQAAELVVVLARQAGQSAAAAQAQRILASASALSVSNELAFARASRELEASLGGQGDERALGQALASAVDVPVRVCRAACDLVVLAGELAAGPISARRADLCGVAQLAAGACATAALLARSNLTLGPEDPRRIQVDQAATTARDAARRMLGGLPPPEAALS